MTNGHVLLSALEASLVLTAVGLAWTIFHFHVYQLRLLARVAAPLEAKQPLTPNEVEFYGRLRKALPEYDVLAQVSLSALIKTSLPETHPEFWSAFDRFSRKVADFVVVDRKTMRALLVVELDDRSHDTKRDKDKARDAMLASAGLRTLRWDSRAKPSIATIQSTVAGVLRAS